MYQSIYVVKKTDLDALMHVNNIKYVEWVQKIAEAHWLDQATDHLKEKYFWVMLSHYIEYKSQAFLNDEVLLQTYITKSDGATSIRIVEILNKATYKLIAKSETKWCLMNVQTKRPSRITQEISDLFI